MVTDAHRLLGPLPFDDVPSVTVAGLLAELDRLDIARAYVTHTWSLFADPDGGNEALLRERHDRLSPVPVVIPGTVPPRKGWWADGVRMVRLCPARHRFDLGGPVAVRTLEALAESGFAAVIDLEETTPAALRALDPALTVLLVNPGFRRLRELAELLAATQRLYVETGTLMGGIEWLHAHGGAGRLVFGTGAPVLDDCGPRFQLDHLDLPPEAVAQIAAGALEKVETL